MLLCEDNLQCARSIPLHYQATPTVRVSPPPAMSHPSPPPPPDDEVVNVNQMFAAPCPALPTLRTHNSHKYIFRSINKIVSKVLKYICIHYE